MFPWHCSLVPLIWDCFFLQICCNLRSLNFKRGCCHSTSLYIKNWHAIKIKQSLGRPIFVFGTDSHRVTHKSLISLLPPDTHLLLPEGFGSCSVSSVFFPGINFSALSKRALRATLRNTFPWASLINWTSCRISQYKPWAARHQEKEQFQSAVSTEALRANTSEVLHQAITSPLAVVSFILQVHGLWFLSGNSTSEGKGCREQFYRAWFLICELSWKTLDYSDNSQQGAKGKNNLQQTYNYTCILIKVFF